MAKKASKPKEEQQGRLIPLEDFDLIKFKVSRSGLNITYKVKGITDREKTEDVHNDPHPDLQEKLDQLKLYMGLRLGYLEGWDFARDNIKGKLAVTEKVIEGFNQAKDRFKVTGLNMVEKGEKFGVQIIGSLKCPDGGSSRLDVPPVFFEEEENGLEYADDVQQICKEVINEVYSYLILNKKYQTNIEDQAEGFDNGGGVQTDLVEESEKATSE